MGPDAVVRRKHDTDGVGFESPSGNDESGLSYLVSDQYFHCDRCLTKTQHFSYGDS